MSSEIAAATYHIKHPTTGLFVIPRTPDETVSPLALATLDDPSFPQLAFVWSFIEIEANVFQIVNEKTRLCIQVKGGDNPPLPNESVHQNTCGIVLADEKWFYRGGRFECFQNPNLMWEPVNQGDKYFTIVVNPARGANSEWVLVTVTPGDTEAKGTTA